VANGVVYFGCGSSLCALDARTGVKLWSYATHGVVGSPAVVNGMLYVGSADRNVYAFGLK
jgi:serine/threonine-protein kinase